MRGIAAQMEPWRWNTRFNVFTMYFDPPRTRANLGDAVEIYITHLKPGEDALIMREIDTCMSEYRPRRLLNDQRFEF